MDKSPASVSNPITMSLRVLEVREATGLGVEQVEDVRIARLLQSHAFDLKTTAAAVRKHHELAEWFTTAPIPTCGENPLVSQRFVYKGLNKDKHHMILIDWMWGHMPNVPMDALLEAYVIFVRKICRESIIVGGEAKFVVINIGGPPPTEFMEYLVQMRAVHFPERVANILCSNMDASSEPDKLTRNFLRWKTTVPNSDFKVVSAVSDLAAGMTMHEDKSESECHSECSTADTREKSPRSSASASDEPSPRVHASADAWKNLEPLSVDELSPTLQDFASQQPHLPYLPSEPNILGDARFVRTVQCDEKIELNMDAQPFVPGVGMHGIPYEYPRIGGIYLTDCHAFEGQLDTLPSLPLGDGQSSKPFKGPTGSQRRKKRKEAAAVDYINASETPTMFAK